MRIIYVSNSEIQLDDDPDHPATRHDLCHVRFTRTELNCWVLGDDSSHVFAVNIARLEVVSFLKEAIKDKTKSVFGGIDARSLRLWKVSNTRLHVQHTLL